VLLISAVPVYIAMSERRCRRQSVQQIQQQRQQYDLAAEVEQMRRGQPGE
jgi:hypothetical protein